MLLAMKTVNVIGTSFVSQMSVGLLETPNQTLRTLTRHLSLLQPYLTSKGLLKLSHESYNPTTSALLTNLSLLYDSYWRTLKTKTNRATDGEQFIKSNAATARPLILVRPAEIWTSDWLNTNERLEMVISTITLLSTIYKQTTESTGTLLNALPTVRTTINESLWKAGLLT